MSHNRKLPFVNTNLIGLERAVYQQTSNSAKGTTKSVATEFLYRFLLLATCFNFLKSHYQAIKGTYEKR
jgi:hypothetical protein